jgi:hypothetical protein
MDVENLIAFIKSQGYTNVKVDVYKDRFRVRYCSPEYNYNIARYYNFPISELPSNPDGSKRYRQLLNAFPSVNGDAKTIDPLLTNRK